MSTIEIKKIGITKLDTDAIVNAANERLRRKLLSPPGRRNKASLIGTGWCSF